MSPLRRVLVSIDLDPSVERIVQRASRLPLAGDARIVILHVVPKLFRKDAQRRAAADARKAVDRAARQLAAAVPGASVQAMVKTGSPAAEIAKAARAVRADLLIMGRGKGRGLIDAFLGSTAERVIRQGQLPVLVVRLPVRGAYRRPMVAVDLDAVAVDVLAYTLRALPAPWPTIGVVHAFDPPFAPRAYPSVATAVRHYYADYRARARRELQDLVARVPAGAETPPHWKLHLHHGSPRAKVPQLIEATQSDLLALGTHGYTGAAHAFLGTVAGDLLRDATCDVLVVPPPARSR